jgi:serine/threonine protein kinase
MKAEYENAIKILAPFYHIDDISKRRIDDHYRLKTMRESEFTTLQEEARSFRVHPGYNNMHKIFHYDPMLMCIFSEYCHGTLNNIIRNVSLSGAYEYAFHGINFGDFHKILIRDMMNAVSYLMYVGIAHQDIKPDNILYKVELDANGKIQRLVFMVCDYGLCCPMDSRGMTKEPCGIRGTSTYIPQKIIDLVDGPRGRGGRHNYLVESQMFCGMAFSILESLICRSHGLCAKFNDVDTIEFFCLFYYFEVSKLKASELLSKTLIDRSFPLFIDFLQCLVSRVDHVNGPNDECKRKFETMLASL